MAKREELVTRFLRSPADFTWEELTRLLSGSEYAPDEKGRTSGSRVRFPRTGYPPINLHKPHPGNIVKRYQLRQVYELLRAEGLLGDDDEP